MSYYVYEYWNPLTGVPFYVGKGKNDRAYIHLKEAIAGRRVFENPYKHYTIRKILNEGNSPIIKIVFRIDDEQQAFDEEIRLIKKYGRRDLGTGTLTNMTDGGDNPPSQKGRTKSEETKQKLRGRIPWNKGKKMPEEFRKKIKKSCKTRKAHSPESHKRQAEKHRGFKHSDESKEKMSKMLKKAWKTRERKDPWNKGKTLSNEIKQKISQTLKGTVCSEETRQKMRISQRRAWRKRKLIEKK